MGIPLQERKRKSYAENIERIKEYQRKNSELFKEELKELLKVYGELGVDLFQHTRPDKVKDAIKKVRGVFDVTNSVYSAAEAWDSRNKALARADALEGLVTLTALSFELNPELKTLPAYRMLIFPLDRLVTGLKITERLIEAGKHSENLDLFLENQSHVIVDDDSI